MKPKIGVRVKIKGKHASELVGKTGVIKKISTPAIGVQVNGKLHKWFVQSELEKSNRSK